MATQSDEWLRNTPSRLVEKVKTVLVPVQPSVVDVPLTLNEFTVQLQYCGELELPVKLGT